MYDFVEQHDGYTISRKIYQPTDRRLGRNVRHDSRSLMFQVKAQDVSTLKSVRHERHIPTLDQGQLGSCTGNAATGALGTQPFWPEGLSVLNPTDAEVDETYAVNVYSDATKVDPYQGTYPPTDTGSDGLSVAQVLKTRGLISGYVHATSLEAALTALSQTPVIAGVEWRNDMFNPDADGRIHITGDVAGGHEIVLDELDVENKRVWIHNSWGDGWGVDGRAYFTWDDFSTLLSRAGDVTQFVPVSQPAPTPVPPEPTPQPTPSPEVDPTVVQEVLAAARHLVHKLERLLGVSNA